MKKSWNLFLHGTLSIMLLGGALAFGNDSVTSNEIKSEQQDRESAETMDFGGLTPRRKKDKTLILAQQPSKNQQTFAEPVAPPAASSATFAPPVASNYASAPHCNPADNYVYAELERLSAELSKLKKDTKKPDTKKAWGSPKIAGRIFLDTYGIDQGDRSDIPYGDLKNKGGFREMQISVAGKGFDSFDYKLEFSLSPNSGRVNLVDNWIGVKNLPLLGYVRAGHFKPETGLAYPASALHTSLTEFVGPTSSFGLGRRFGIASENLFANDRARLFMGVFQEGATNTDRYIQEDNQGQVFNMRLSTAPIYSDGGRHVLHFGGHWSYVSPKNGQSSMSTNFGSIGWLPSSVTTGSFANNHHHRFGFEAAYQRGPFAVQSEIFSAKYAGYKGRQDSTANGAYVELKYFLTGEHRTYDLAKGMFGAAKVNRNFHPHACGDWNLIDGFGAWQTVLQWSYLDLTDWRDNRVIDGKYTRLGGRQNDITLGLNWFWTPNIRWVFEYVHSQQNIGSDKLHCYEDIFGTSLRLHF